MSDVTSECNAIRSALKKSLITVINFMNITVASIPLSIPIFQAMEFWLLLVCIICLCASLHPLSSLLVHTQKLPPGPPTIPFLGNFIWLLRSSRNFSALEPIIRRLRAKYGPIVTIRIGSRPAIFITSHDIAHKALVQSGAAFASRPRALETTKIIFSNQHTVTTAAYGSLWRILRQNLMSLIHPTKLHLFAKGRKWALNILKKELQAEAAQSKKAIFVLDHLKHSMYSLLLYMCFGEELEETLIRTIVEAQRATLSNFIRFNILNFLPALGKIVFKKLWKELLEIRRNQENVIMPLIKARQERKRKDMTNDDHGKERVLSYVDTLLDLQLPGGEREFSDGELVSLCSEFINAGTDTSATTLQWAMANLVKHQDIQEKLLEEINSVVRPGDEIKEEDLNSMPYLKAVVLETLRRHPPGHFILPRAVVEDTELEGYDIPSNAIVNFTVAEMARDPRVWEDPLEFRPERFLGDGGESVVFDIKGVREIKMMPFGAGRRVCPAITMAILHQEYYVANLIRDFKWTPEDGDEVDLSEDQDFTIVMKKPLRAHVIPRVSDAVRLIFPCSKFLLH